MRVIAMVITILVLCAGMLLAQSTAPQAPPAGGQAASGAGGGRATRAPEQPGHGMQDMSVEHQHEMQQVQAQVQQMHALLTQMRSNVASMDPKDQPAMMTNIQLWQMLLDHMDQMVKNMQSMGPGMHGMHHGPMHHGGMGPKEGTPPAPPPGQAPPPPPQQ